MAGSFGRLTRWKHFRWVFPLALAVVIYCGYLAMRPEPGFPPLPVPNGYDDLLHAAQEVSGEPPSTAPGGPVNVAELKTVVNANQEPLRHARVGLSRECGVPLGSTRAQLDARLNTLGEIRKISRLLAAEGKVAESEGRTADAASTYLDLYRLGRKVSTGGVMIDSSMGFAFESLGAMGLGTIRRKLPPNECLRVSQSLLEIDRDRESPVRAVQRDRLWFNRTAGTWERFALGVTGAGQAQLKPAIAQLELGDRRSQVFLRLLIVDLALNAHHAETGDYPETLDALPKRELAAVPIDPFSGHPLIYARKGPDYVLYSIGPDGRDDHGNPIAADARWDQAPGDVVLSPP